MGGQGRNGTVALKRFRSTVLKDNPLGDPPVRTVPVYLPPGYARSRRRYPVVFVLTGFTGRGVMLLNHSAFSENLAERMDRLIAEGTVAPMILVMPDCFTRYGGSQYLNSAATGRYEDHVVKELVPWADRTFRTLKGRRHRGLVGKSSGGYGALVLGMRHPNLFAAVASHAGDMYFELCYKQDFPRFVRVTGTFGGPAEFLRRFPGIEPKSSDHILALNTLAMASCYAPNPRAPLGFDLPCDPATGELDETVWKRWLAWDPVRMVETSEAHRRALRRLSLLYLDAGTRDEFHLHLGARIFTRRLDRYRIPHQYEEFEGGHMGINFRYDSSLAALSQALAPA